MTELVSDSFNRQKAEPVPGEDATDPGMNKATRTFLIIAGVVLVVVFGFLLFGFKGVKMSKNVVEYNYYVFEEVDGFWQTIIERKGQPYLAAFRFNPLQVKSVNVSGNFSGFDDRPVYLTFDPVQDESSFKFLALANSELALHLIRGLNVSVEAACTENVTEACENRSIVRCGDDANVIYVVAKGVSSINLSKTCVTLSGEGFDILKSVDRLLYQWYKIMH